MASDEGAWGCAANGADAHRHDYVSSHEDAGEDEEPGEFVSVISADVGTDEEAAGAEYDAGGDECGAERFPPWDILFLFGGRRLFCHNNVSLHFRLIYSFFAL